VTPFTHVVANHYYRVGMLSFLSKFRARGPQVELLQDDDRLLVALVNEARSDAQRARLVELARRRASARR
jgi:hypothetical protein